MKTLKLRSIYIGLLTIGVLIFTVISCNKDQDEDPVQLGTDTAQGLENDEDALEMLRLVEANADYILQAMRKQNMTAIEFQSLYESGNDAQIAQALSLDVALLAERDVKIQELALRVNAKYPNLESLVDDGQVHQDPFVTMGYALDSSGKGKCSGWRNWRNIGKYTVCVAACATSTAGVGYVLCSLVCYFSFCT